MKVQCINNSDLAPHLTLWKSYDVSSSDGDMYIIKDDSGMYGWYKKSRFTIESESVKNIDIPSNQKFSKVEKPEHYHMYNMDTLTFLENGFPSSVLEGFLIGNVIKYTQRYKLKNGQEDLEKVKFYSKRLAEFNENMIK